LARAYVGLAEVYTYLIDLGLAPSVEEALSKQMEAAQKAVRLDANDGKAHLALGEAYAFHGKPEQALAEFARAETLAPSDADLLLSIAWVISYFGEVARAVNLADQWSAERYLIETGGAAEKESELFVNGARMAGLLDCVPADKLKNMPNPIRVKSCDQ
jgi:tetratricopeptide (TPR) repeat protein